MNEDNLQRAVKKVISFGVFTAGVLSILTGFFLIINSLVSSQPYIFEGGVAIGMGLILIYLVDQSILNTKRHDMLKEMIKENNIQSQRQRGGGGILGSILGGVGLGDSPVDIKIIRGGEDDFMNDLGMFGNQIVSEGENHPNFIKEVQEVMLKTSLSEEDAKAVVLLQGSTVDQMQKAREEFKEDDRFELVVFVDKMIQGKEKENKKNDQDGNNSK